MILRQGDHGLPVEQLQLHLKAAGYDPGDVDGNYGAKTAAAVFAFQTDRPDLDDDGVAGPMTLGALDAAVVHRDADLPRAVPSSPSATVVPCDAVTWTAFQHLVGAVTAHPVRYGPGRGLWHDEKFVVTCGPGALGSKSWPNALGRPFASFHCTSWTNFFLGWLFRRNDLYTHAGNIPSLFDLLEATPDLHTIPGGGIYRGYGNVMSPIVPDGSSVRRSGVSKVIDAQELLARRATLPTFLVCGQSTKQRSGEWLLWHHTVLYVVDHHDHDRLYRIAADGYKGAQGYSGDPLRWVEINDKNVGALSAAIYRVYGANSTADGTYGDTSKPIAEIDFEEA